MKKRHNSAPWAPDEASPYLNESSRCAESESEEHFVRKAHFSAHFSVKKCYFSVNKKLQNWVEIKFQRNIWGQLDVRTRMRASKSWNFDLEKPIKPIKMDSCVIFADHCIWSDLIVEDGPAQRAKGKEIPESFFLRKPKWNTWNYQARGLQMSM